MGAPEDAVEEDADARASQIEKELKLEKLRLKKLKARTKAMRREKFKSAVMPMAACVSRIDVDGLERTHNDVVENIVRKLFYARNYGDLVGKVKEVHKELKTLGCFSNVDIKLERDEDEEDDKLLQILIDVEEIGWFTSKISSDTTNHGDGKVTWKSSIPNLLGRGESVRLHLSRRWSVNGTDGCLQLATSRINTRTGRVSYLAEAGRRRENVLWRGLFLKEYYTSLTATFDPFPWLQQELSAAVSARDLEIANGNWTHNPDLVPFSAREQCGYSMKSSLSQTVKVDTRDDSVLPSKGTLLKWFSELSGPIGDAAFFKNELLGSIYLPFTSSATLSLSCSAAMLTPLGPAASAFSSAAADATRFKNPLQCRGWNNSACSAGDFSFGQHSRLLAVASSVKLSFPVPFLRGAKTWILRNTRTHVFCDYGATGGVAYPGFRLWDTVSRIDEWAQFSSLTAGIGVALRLGDFGRAELNYCHPLHGNASLRGLQLGIGVNIL